jgi:hypothetical protein
MGCCLPEKERKTKERKKKERKKDKRKKEKRKKERKIENQAPAERYRQRQSNAERCMICDED